MFIEVARNRPILMLLAFTACLGSCRRSGPPYSPPKALRTFQIEPGFRIETFVSEPLITSPVDMEFDENGRIYVVEMGGYPLNTEGKAGRIKLLEDTNDDGRPDRATVFADQLVFPSGVMPWKNGVLVSDAPNVWYLEDSDGDRKADVRRVVLTGFASTNPEHTVNNPTYGLDNWIYLAHEGWMTAIRFADKFGDQGSEIRFPDRPGAPRLKVEQANLRFRPDTHQLEYLSGRSQFGYTMDEWGRQFTHWNTSHANHEVIAARYLRRNPALALASAVREMTDHGSAVFPITHSPRYHALTGVGEFTAACGLTAYREGAVVAEPAHNLVHRDVWTRSGVSFTARRAREGAEFLASTDAWFRPVNFTVGPDGALYVVDFYREIVEHPEWLTEEEYRPEELYHGSDRGRIYRIVAESDRTPPQPPRMGKASDEELVRFLEHPNAWWRRTAQRLLVDRKSGGARELLIHLFETAPSPLGRLHALWTLDGLGRLDLAQIDKALQDPEPGVRENAIALAEWRLSDSPSLVDRLFALAADPDARVRFQLLCTLGEIDSPRSRAVRDELMWRDIEDPWMQAAALSSRPHRAFYLFQTALSRREPKTEMRLRFFRQAASVIAASRNPEEVRRLLQILVGAPPGAWWRAAGLQGLVDSLRGSTLRAISQDLLAGLFEDPEPAVRRSALRLLESSNLHESPLMADLRRRAAQTATDRRADPDRRPDALELLGLFDPRSHEALFRKLVDPKEPEAVQVAAVRALGGVQGDEPARFLLGKWRSMTPSVRSEAVAAFFREPGRGRLLVEAMLNDQVQPWMLSFQQRRRLMMNLDPATRAAAARLVEKSTAEREQVLARYQAALKMEGDRARGRQLFEQLCAHCHQFQGAGAEVGPDLGTVRHRPPQELLSDILLPNRSITQNYEAWVVEMASGGILEGVLGSQTPTTITLRQEHGRHDTIRRDEIKRMYAANLSAMPEDMEQRVSVAGMADLIEFLRTGR